MSSRADFKLSKIEIIFRDEEVEEEEQGPQEVPMFDQTMSLLEMIKEKKVKKKSNPEKSLIFDFDFSQEKERQQIKDEKIRQMALAQKAKMAQKNETRLRLR